jgi:hypothetical protein
VKTLPSGDTADPNGGGHWTRDIVFSRDAKKIHIDSLAKKYLGKDQYPYRRPGEVRVMYEIEPVSVSGMS